MADTIGTIKYDFMIDTSGASKGVSDAKKAANEVAKSAEASASQTESKFAGAFSKIAGVAGNAAKKIGSALVSVTKAAVTAGAGMVTAMAGASVKMYADYEQNIGGIETLFKDASSTVEQYAENAFKTAGMSANTYMETVTSFSARLLQGLGGDTQKAAEISNMAVTDMADNANKMGTSMESLQNAYQGFAKQNYTMLDNLKLGYGGTASEMARLINDSGVLGDTMQVTAQTVNDVSFDKMIEAIHKVQDNMGITGTTAKEAASTISGSFGMMRSAWDNLLTFIGSGKGNLDEVLANLMESVKTFATNLMPVIESILVNLANAINDVAPLIIEKLPEVINSIVPPLLTATISIAQAIIRVLPGIISSLISALVSLLPQITQAVSDLLVQIVVSIANILPQLLTAVQELVFNLVIALTSPENLNAIFDAALKLLTGLVEAIPQLIINLLNALPKIINNIVNFLLNPSNIKKIIKAGVQLFLGLVKAVPQILGALIGAFGSLFGNLWNSVTGLFSSFAANFGNTIGNIFRGAINGVISFIENFINLPIQTINGFIGVLNGVLGAVGASIGYIPTISLPRLYTGGVVEGRGQGRIIVAGDGGEDEWVVPESKMGSLLEQLEQRGAGGGNVTINVMGTFATSASEQRKVAEQIYQRLQELDRARFGGATV